MCALVLKDNQLRIKGPHALTEQEERTLLSKLEPLVRDLPTPESGEVLATFPAGRPHHVELSQEWVDKLDSREAELNPGPQKRLDEYVIDIEEYLEGEVEAILPDLCSTPYRWPTVF